MLTSKDEASVTAPCLSAAPEHCQIVTYVADLDGSLVEICASVGGRGC
jgi:hypothetical protein